MGQITTKSIKNDDLELQHKMLLDSSINEEEIRKIIDNFGTKIDLLFLFNQIFINH